MIYIKTPLKKTMLKKKPSDCKKCRYYKHDFLNWTCTAIDRDLSNDSEQDGCVIQVDNNVKHDILIPPEWCPLVEIKNI